MLLHLEGTCLPQSRDIKYLCKLNQPLVKSYALVLASRQTLKDFILNKERTKLFVMIRICTAFVWEINSSSLVGEEHQRGVRT